jgi:N-acetylmuramoyl-L-alanine amidase
MRWLCGCLVLIGLGGGLALAPAGDKAQGPTELFNGKDLSSWKFRGGDHGPVAFRNLRLTPRSAALEGAVIVVDPGHGGQRYSKSYTGGTRGVVSKVTESELNLRVAVELEKLLKDQGATVFMTRRADHRLSPEGSSNKDELHARIDFFEHHAAHFFLSVHHNAGAASATGHTALYKHNAKDDTLYEALATAVNDALEGAVPGPKLKLIKGSYHILRETPFPERSRNRAS